MASVVLSRYITGINGANNEMYFPVSLPGYISSDISPEKHIMIPATPIENIRVN